MPEVRTLTSSIVDQEFRIFVALSSPFGRDYGDSNKTYPVLYVLDPYLFFGMTTETVRLLQLGQQLPVMIIVGIGYQTDTPIDVAGLRARDFTPTIDDSLLEGYLTYYGSKSFGSRKAEEFLQFIRQELKPFIQLNYAADPDDASLLGDSFGGLFALYSLFHYPDTFNRYIIGSPSIPWDDKITIKYEASYAANYSGLPAKVFMSVGSLEESEDDPDSTMITDLQNLAKTLRDRNYDNLDLTTHIFENETHLSVIPATISRGLRVVFG